MECSDAVFGPPVKNKAKRNKDTYTFHTPFGERINFLGALDRL
jgi:hypothetical protein